MLSPRNTPRRHGVERLRTVTVSGRVQAHEWVGRELQIAVRVRGSLVRLRTKQHLDLRIGRLHPERQMNCTYQSNDSKKFQPLLSPASCTLHRTDERLGCYRIHRVCRPRSKFTALVDLDAEVLPAPLKNPNIRLVQIRSGSPLHRTVRAT
jgi:hypothetical protein